MGSLNGDVMVIRNGRSTSQVSIYNYPEHLNPFYEDDQHKRLRFWKINKKDNEGRRNSFSIGNLKDMWAFKTFRMKKKSSTLGINKTSESPPTLRRDYVIDNGWNTFDHRLRDSNTTSLNPDNFQRNATYRSSLQTLPTGTDRIGLNRNDGYRSTIQVTRSNHRYQQQQQRPQSTEVSHNRRYVYGGSVTPQPLRNTNFGRNPCENDSNIVVRRSSQTSMVSTNPFESDDDENEDINLTGIRSVNGGSTTTLTSRTPRKKRRAPAPPTPVHNRNNAPPPPTILIESSHDIINDKLRIEEDIDIANLTAEIQSFVETTNNDNVEITQNSDHTEIMRKTTTSPTIITSKGEKYETNEEQNSNVKATESTKELLKKHEKDSIIEENTSEINTSKDLINNSFKAENNANHKTTGKITTKVETMTATETKTTSSKISNEVNTSTVIESNTNKVSNEIVTKTNESKEFKSNGAIPKKPNSTSDTSLSTGDQQQQQQDTITVVDDLCIKESNNENVSSKPLPLKRQTKPEPEVGHVECIHIHVESPRATPLNDHTIGISSFKTNESHEASESITTKTPFVLTSPPSQKRIINQSQAENFPVTKETVKILKAPNSNERVSELNINEERINPKPEILVKPTLSPKPILKDCNGKMHGFAEIHKPLRTKYSNNQNGHVRRALREGSVSPPLIPFESTKEKEEKKINNSNECKSETNTEIQLTIVETSNVSTNKPVNKNDEQQHKEISNETSVISVKESLKRDDELDFLYRPKPVPQMEWKRSTLAPLETNIPPEKRKSVKDIIESINRSQRLLNAAANKDFTTLNTTTTNPSGGFPEVITTQTKTVENDTQKIMESNQNNVEHINGAAAVSPSPSPSPSPSNYNELADGQKLDNNDIFQKCKVKKEVYDYRETSPISSNLDWNPVPKPKRTKPGQD